MTTHEAADRLGIKARSVVALIKRGQLTATKHGRDYWIDEAEIARYERERRPAHRPRKEHAMSAICPQCKRDMSRTRTCSNRTIELQGQVYDLIPYGSERPEGRAPDGPEYVRCHDCGVKRGGYHHPRCDMEECPRCHGQLLGCSCQG